MAPSVEVQDENARKERIISHMNREHTRELRHILQHYNGLKASHTKNASMRDISLESMRILAGGLNHTVPFTPVLKSWDQVRQRLVDMDADARKALNISDIYVNQYLPPSGADWVVFTAVSFYFVNALSLPWIVPTTLYGSLVDQYFPGGLNSFTWLVKVLIVPVLGIHFGECFLFDSWRMHRHGVERWSSVWWLWEFSVFTEGVAAWRRFGALIENKKAEKERTKKNH